jgi:hypothetical protein
MRLAAIACLAALYVGGCSEDSGDGGKDTRPDRRETAVAPSPPRARLEAAHCPVELTNCKTASGRIIYVERVDPDGDGDAHFVLTSHEAITLPGLSVIDVKKELRPHPLPGPGDRISAAGPVYRGSYGQKQIEAIELHVARR